MTQEPGYERPTASIHLDTRGKHVPRYGAWSQRLKHVCAFAMQAAGAYFEKKEALRRKEQNDRFRALHE